MSRLFNIAERVVAQKSDNKLTNEHSFVLIKSYKIWVKFDFGLLFANI